MNNAELIFLKESVIYLESPSLLMQIANICGKPLDTLLNLPVLPPDITAKISEIVRNALLQASNVAGATVFPTNIQADLLKKAAAADWIAYYHILATMVAGGAAGIFGLPGLAIELPATTMLMMRSISAIAQEFGNDISNPSVHLECLAIFSYGGPSKKLKEMDSAFYSTRLTMRTLINQANNFMANHGYKTFGEALAKGKVPTLLTVINYIASCFNIVVTEKFLAQTIPMLGIITGAAINAAFTDHFNKVAKYTFGINNLEALYGADNVETEYKRFLPKRI